MYVSSSYEWFWIPIVWFYIVFSFRFIFSIILKYTMHPYSSFKHVWLQCIQKSFLVRTPWVSTNHLAYILTYWRKDLSSSCTCRYHRSFRSRSIPRKYVHLAVGNCIGFVKFNKPLEEFSFLLISISLF